ncbi:hypothetical protein AX16_002280 [Volvariella volvacea WC 439]|nr:hypothetical protein AX16_002280 [Volvariella volvacea WC 439]
MTQAQRDNFNALPPPAKQKQKADPLPLPPPDPLLASKAAAVPALALPAMPRAKYKSRRKFVLSRPNDMLSNGIASSSKLSAQPLASARVSQNDRDLALALQQEMDDEDRLLKEQLTALQEEEDDLAAQYSISASLQFGGRKNRLVGKKSSSSMSSLSSSSSPSSSSPSSPISSGANDPQSHDDHLAALIAAQQLYDADAKARFDIQLLDNAFKCRICLNFNSTDHVTTIEGCSHEFCQDCVRDYVVSKIEERKYPILCPGCIADSTDGKNVQEIDDTFLQTVGIPDDTYELYQDLQKAQHSVKIQCFECKFVSWVIKDEFHQTKVLSCPSPGGTCNHKWCKDCNQDASMLGVAHTCDGTNEFQDLFERRNWKRCPTCRTPVEWLDGCYHMICSGAGCNTHFCYSCGDFLIKTNGSRDGVQAVLDQHYSSKCILFYIPPGV